MDILYVHGLGSRKEVLFEPHLRNIEAAKKSGKARFVGVSTHGNEPEVIRAADREPRPTTSSSPPTISGRQNLADLDKAITRPTRPEWGSWR